MVALGKLQRTATVEESIFERRSLRIQPTAIQAQALRHDHSIAARRQPRLDIEVQDVSANGLSALACEPLNEGEQVTIHFPRTNQAMPLWDAFGRVVECQPDRSGYRVSVEFAPLPAA